MKHIKAWIFIKAKFQSVMRVYSEKITSKYPKSLEVDDAS